MSDAPDASEPVNVVDYDSAWPRLFAEEGERIRAALGDAAAPLQERALAWRTSRVA